MLSAAVVIGGLVLRGLDMAGWGDASPKSRFAAIDRRDSLLARSDTVQIVRMGSIEAKIDRVERLQLQMAAMRCLDPSDARIAAISQLPCGRIIRDLEIKP